MKQRVLYTLSLLFATLQTFAQTYTYDNLNRLTKVVYKNGTTVAYTYDALGNRLTKKVTGASTTKYTLTTTVTPAGSGSVTGGGTYGRGTMVELNAIPNAGYDFQKWSDGVTDNPRSVTVTKNMTYKAQFVENATVPDLLGDIVTDGKVNNLDLSALVDAYLNSTNVTLSTDLDEDGSLSIADITKLVDIVNEGRGDLKSNGHEFVDLGLPSGALWATCNVGASAPEEDGDFFAWGETETKDVYSWETYKWCNGTTCSATEQTLTKYCDRGGYGVIDGKLTLEPEDDAARAKWGGDWHMPTKEEMQELIDYCSVERFKLSDGKKAFKFTGRNGNYIILPCSGHKKNDTYIDDDLYYWTLTLHMNEIPSNNHGTHADVVEYYYNSSELVVELVGISRFRGCPVRPVLSKYKPITHKITGAPASYLNHDLVDLGLPSGSLWATHNLGSTKPEGMGCYYAWGETTGSCEGKTNFDTSTLTTNMNDYVEPGDQLEPGNDAAKQKWGGEWRMPTSRDFRELVNDTYTTWEWTTVNGVNGYRVTSKVIGFEGNNIFLPAAGRYQRTNLKNVGERGYYWSSTLYSGPDSSHNATQLYMTTSSKSVSGNLPYYGLTIRPVVSLDAINE